MLSRSRAIHFVDTRLLGLDPCMKSVHLSEKYFFKCIFQSFASYGIGRFRLQPKHTVHSHTSVEMGLGNGHVNYSLFPFYLTTMVHEIYID